MKAQTTPSETMAITSVAEAINALDNEVMRDLKPPSSPKRGDQEFGVWFRGHERLNYELVPSMLRISREQGKRNYINEISLTRHFKAMNPDATRPDASDFEWLVTMQHYLAPTRLLDWTENLLVGLYFAVRDSGLDGEDAALWILNARRLNHYSSASIRAEDIAFPEDPDVIARSCLCRVKNREEWHDVFQRELKRVVSDRSDARQQLIAKAIKNGRQIGSSVNDINRSELDLKKFNQTEGTNTKPIDLYKRDFGKKPEGIYARLRMPVAVYAGRTNRRIRSQSGVFTLHGGKYEPDPTEFEPNEFHEEPIGMPISLLEIDSGLPEEEKILRWFLIPSTHRSAIRRTLAQIGISEASLFPELDYQSKYLVSRWTYKAPIEESDGD